jgi:hypothetical protein
MLDYLSPNLETVHLDIGNSSSRVKQVAIANIDSTPYSFGEDLGELGSTLRYLSKPVNGLANAAYGFYKVVKKYEKIGYSHARAVAQAWLEYRFAFSPLVRSASDLLESFSYKQKTMPVRLSSHGRTVAKDSLTSKDTQAWGSTAKVKFTRESNIETSLHASILYQVSNPIYDWKYRYGLRAKDLPTTYWQLMPYSFMVDRVVDISSFLKGVINLSDPSISILCGSFREKHISFIKDYASASNGSTGTGSGTSNVSVLKNVQYLRSPWSPSVLDTIPKSNFWNLVNSATKMADLVSLVSQRVR